MRRLFLICTLFFVLMGCQSNTSELKQSNPIINANPGNNSEADILIRTINEYYNLEKSESWDKAYDYRTPLFRQTEMKDSYIEQMRKDSEGWRLVKFEIVGLNLENNRAIAKIKFTEESPRAIIFKGTNEQICEEDTKWIKYGDQWYSLDPGDRLHLALNTELVKE